MLFIIHAFLWGLTLNGMTAIICFLSIMYRGCAEQKIRRYLVDNNYIDRII